MFSRIASSVGLKLSLFVSLIAILVFAILLVEGAVTEHRTTLKEMGARSISESQLIYSLIEKPMTVGNDEGTRNEFKFLASNFQNFSANLLSFDGTISYSTSPEKNVLQPFDKIFTDPELQALIRDSLKNASKGSLLLRDKDSMEFTHVVGIANQPTCHHCHGSSQPVLGALMITRDVTDIMHGLQNSLIVRSIISMAAVLCLVGLVMVYIRKLVVNRLARLTATSSTVAGGDFHVEFDTQGTDELSQLSAHTATMVAYIKKELGFSKGILRGMTTPCVVCDIDGRISYVNKSVMRCFGRTGKPSDYIGMRAAEFLLGDDTKDCSLYKTLRTGETTRGMMLDQINQKGESVRMLADASPLFDLDDNLIGAFTIYNDLTEQYKQQQSIEVQNNRIAKAAEAASSISMNLSRSSTALAKQVERASADAQQARQAAGLGASATTQMNSTVTEVAKNADETAKLALNTQEKASQGAEVVRKAVECISRVAEQVEELSGDMLELNKQAEGITRIITVIDEIADQTNLLALNAAIEAARAGESGRGFAVVADEVRKLAEKTMEATRQVAANINKLRESINKGSSATGQTVALVEESTTHAEQSGLALDSILHMVERTSDNVRSIAEATNEQALSCRHVAESVENINNITENTAQIMEEAASSVDELAKLAHELNDVIKDMHSDS